MIDATFLKAHQTAASLLKKGLFSDVSRELMAACIPSSMLSGMAVVGR